MDNVWGMYGECMLNVCLILPDTHDLFNGNSDIRAEENQVDLSMEFIRNYRRG